MWLNPNWSFLWLHFSVLRMEKDSVWAVLKGGVKLKIGTQSYLTKAQRKISVSSVIEKKILMQKLRQCGKSTDSASTRSTTLLLAMEGMERLWHGTRIQNRSIDQVRSSQKRSLRLISQKMDRCWHMQLGTIGKKAQMEWQNGNIWTNFLSGFPKLWKCSSQETVSDKSFYKMLNKLNNFKDRT